MMKVAGTRTAILPSERSWYARAMRSVFVVLAAAACQARPADTDLAHERVGAYPEKVTPNGTERAGDTSSGFGT